VVEIDATAVLFRGLGLRSVPRLKLSKSIGCRHGFITSRSAIWCDKSTSIHPDKQSDAV